MPLFNGSLTKSSFGHPCSAIYMPAVKHTGGTMPKGPKGEKRPADVTAAAADQKNCTISLLFYGMARPSVDGSRSVGGACQKERERVMTIATIGIDLGKNSCSLAGAGRHGRGGAAPSPVAGQARRVPAPPAGVRGGDGGVLRRASPRAALRGAGPRGAADVAGIRPAVREGAEERRPRRGGDRRGGDAADHAVRGAEVGGAARPADVAPGAVAAGERPHAADEPAAGDPARAWNHGGEGPAGSRSRARRPARRRRGRG